MSAHHKYERTASGGLSFTEEQMLATRRGRSSRRDNTSIQPEKHPTVPTMPYLVKASEGSRFVLPSFNIKYPDGTFMMDASSKKVIVDSTGKSWKDAQAEYLKSNRLTSTEMDEPGGTFEQKQKQSIEDSVDQGAAIVAGAIGVAGGAALKSQKVQQLGSKVGKLLRPGPRPGVLSTRGLRQRPVTTTSSSSVFMSGTTSDTAAVRSVSGSSARAMRRPLSKIQRGLLSVGAAGLGLVGAQQSLVPEHSSQYVEHLTGNRNVPPSTATGMPRMSQQTALQGESRENTDQSALEGTPLLVYTRRR